MKYLIDIGNSNCKWAYYDGHLHPQQSFALTDLEEGLRQLCAAPAGDVQSVWVASVAKDTVNDTVQAFIHQELGCDVHFISLATLREPPIQTAYQSDRLGIDRYVCLVAAWSLLQKQCIVIDCGTASTVDALDGEGCHLGGVILPSLTTATHGLHAVADKLPKLEWTVELPAEPDVFATNTEAALQAGCHTMLLASIEKAVCYMRASMGDDTPLLVSGGLAEIVLPVLGASARLVKDLALQGIAIVSDSEA